MSFLARLFKSPEPETLGQKLQSLEQFSQAQLSSVANDNTAEEALRAAAIHKLDYSPQLVSFASSENSKQLSQTACKRLGELLDQNRLELETLSQSVNNQRLLIKICGYSSSTGPSLVEKIADEDLLLDIAQSGTTTQIRQAAAEKVAQREALNKLYKAAKNKDKSVLKIVKKKLEVFKVEDAKLEEVHQEISAICRQAEQLAKRDVDDIFHARKQQIETDWTKLASQAKEEAVQRFQSALSRCQQKIDTIVRIQREKEAQKAADREAKKDIHSVLHDMQSFIAELYNNSEPEDIAHDLKDLESRQRSALNEAEIRGLNTENERKRFEELNNAAHSLLERLNASEPVYKSIARLAQISDDAGKTLSNEIDSVLAYAKTLKDVPTPEIVIQSKRAIKQWRDGFKQRAHASREQTKEISEMIRKTNWAISKGHVGRAKAIFRDLEEKVQKIDEVPAHIERKFDDAKTAMQKLGDWHAFAVTPKKQELVDKMQSLTDSSLHPKDLADKIHNLQEHWKELCRGGQNQDEELWEKFQSASQTAYQRCKEYFDEQATLREANADLRRALITQLEEYEREYNWEQADWGEVEKTLKLARETWQSYWPVPRKQIKELQQQFDGILDRIFLLRNDEYEQNKVKKATIVEQSQTLTTLEDNNEAIEKAKSLQAQWQTIGRCKRKDDQELWKAFRSNCDAVFEKRSQENEAVNQERQQAQEQAQTILNELQGILNSNSDEFFEVRAACSDIYKRFQAIGELPRNSSNAINRQYHDLQEKIDARAETERALANDKQWLDVFKVSEVVRQYELKCINKTATPDDKGAVNEALDKLTKCPNNLVLNNLQTRLEMAESLNASTSSASDEFLRILCIRSEIIKGIDSPEADKSFRMNYQVKQLKNNFGQTNTGNQNARTELFGEWINTPAASTEQYQNLLQRFANCWELKISD